MLDSLLTSLLHGRTIDTLSCCYNFFNRKILLLFSSNTNMLNILEKLITSENVCVDYVIKLLCKP